MKNFINRALAAEKKLFLLMVAVMMAVSVLAETTIQSKFFGCTLGKSTREKVEKALKKKNFELVRQDSTHTSLYYKGKFHYAGLEFQDLHIEYFNDTLDCISFGSDFGSKNRENANIVKGYLKEQYNDLDNADSTLFAILYRNRFDTKNIDTWSRKGGGIIVASFSTYNYNQCVFALEPQYSIDYDSLQVHMNELRMYYANYDSANAVTAVAGIKFGDNMYTAKPILRNRSTDVYIEGNRLVGVNTNINGVIYKYSYFFFHREKGLIKVTFLKNYSSYEKSDAEWQFEAILRQFKSRYTNVKMHKNEKDVKLYSCGLYSSDYNYPPIFIMLHKVIDSDTGRTKYQIVVSYYSQKPDPVNNDEI